MPARSHWFPCLALGFTTVALTIIALTRGLNFDETLVLHSGWLYATGGETALGFLMPVVLFIGSAAGLLEDPGLLLPALRFLVVVSVSLAFFYAARVLRAGASLVALWVLFTVANGAFLTHGIEFRYDWVIMTLWIVSFALMLSKHEGRYLALGCIIGVLALHHLKGVFYGFALYLLVIPQLLKEPTWRKSLASFHGALAIPLFAWTMTLLPIGRLDEWIAFYQQFAEVAQTDDVSEKWSRLIARVGSDRGWWALALALVAVSWSALAKSATARWCLVFAAVPAVFLLIHPLPWPYLLAPVVPFVALLMAMSLMQVLESRPRMVPMVLAAALVFAGGSMLREVTPQYERGSLYDQVEVLRFLRTHADPADTVIDPSGFAYFLRPVDSEWYSDTLFRRRAERLVWQTALHHRVESADWAVATYRLRWLPDNALQRIDTSFAPVCGVLWMRPAHPRFAEVAAACPVSGQVIESIW